MKTTFTQHNDVSYSGKVYGSGGTYHSAQVMSTHFENGNLPVGAITFRVIGTGPGKISDYALPYFASIKAVPLVDEYVIILIGPGESANIPQAYYLPSLNIWNHPQHGGRGTNNTPPRLNGVFTEAVDINPMYPFPGDIIVEGRRGQSIRFSESFAFTPWQSLSDKKEPIIAIVNGQISTSEGESIITEDINRDAASIYLTSNNTLPLKTNYKWSRLEEEVTGTKKYSSYISGSEPIEAAYYQGNQVILNSGRLYLNSNKEHVIISAADTVANIGQKFNVDATKSITLEAPIIKFTGDSLDPTRARSAIRGEDLVGELAGLYERLNDLAQDLEHMFSTQDHPFVSAINLKNYTGKLGQARTELSKMLSKRVKLT